MMQKRYLAILAIGIYLVTRLGMVAQKNMYHIDEFATQIVASGNGIQIEEKLDSLKNNKLWYSKTQALNIIFKHNKKFNLKGVTQKLTKTDIHPPLYFWIANTWGSIFGFNKYAFILLNWVIELLLFVSLIKLLQQFNIEQFTYRIVIAIIILIHPFNSEAFILFRHYILLSLLIVLATTSIVKINYAHNIRWFQLLWLLIICYLGTLCHFLFPILAGSLIVAGFIQNRKFMPLLAISVALLLAILLAIVSQYGIFYRLLFSSKSFDNAHFHYSLSYLSALPFRIILTRKMIQAIPWWILSISWLIYLVFVIKASTNSVLRFIFSYTTIIFVVLVFLVVQNKTPIHSLVGNRYFVILSFMLLIGVIFWIFQKTNQRIFHISLLFLLLYGLILSVYQSRLPTKASIVSNKILVVEPYKIELGIIANYMDDKKLMLHTDNENMEELISTYNKNLSVFIRKDNQDVLEMIRKTNYSNMESFDIWEIYTFW